MSYTAEILNAITDRLTVLEDVAKQHSGTDIAREIHAGMYELMSLGEKVKMVMAREKRDILARQQHDLEESWRRSPDRSGGQFSDAEILDSYRNRW